MSTINVSCTDQVLAITNSPVLASGGQHENKIAFNFCELWNGFAKTCMFYQQKGSVIFSMIDANDECEIPAAATAEAGRMYFGVLGVNANGVTRTSAILSYRIVAGTITAVEDPDPSVYQQILAQMADLRAVSESAEAWAVGTRTGQDIPSTDPAYHNNSKYHSEDAEAWAVGKRNGQDVPSTDPAYHNNSKYYSEVVPGVGSFNGRTGIVVPASGDYTPDMVGAAAAPTYTTASMASSSWSNKTYSFESTYPHADYDIAIFVAPTATEAQFDAFAKAKICGSANSNVVKALGTVPSVNIPIIIKVVAK